MVKVHVCIPVLRRYDLLRRLLLSLKDSTVLPQVHLIDNGRDANKLQAAVWQTCRHIQVYNPSLHDRSLSVAESWNAFLEHVPEERVIVNDDIVFAPHSLQRMVETGGDMIFAHGFSCFLIRNSCVEKVGKFDENISPGYAYYEDCDYMERMRLECQRGNWVSMHDVDAGVKHGEHGQGSCTFRVGTDEEVNEHWRRHHLAHMNFLQKYGAEPDELERRFKLWQRENEVQA